MPDTEVAQSDGSIYRNIELAYIGLCLKGERAGEDVKRDKGYRVAVWVTDFGPAE